MYWHISYFEVVKMYFPSFPGCADCPQNLLHIVFSDSLHLECELMLRDGWLVSLMLQSVGNFLIGWNNTFSTFHACKYSANCVCVCIHTRQKFGHAFQWLLSFYTGTKWSYVVAKNIINCYIYVLDFRVFKVEAFSFDGTFAHAWHSPNQFQVVF